MRQVNNENIELLMFDYVEGNLSAEEMKELDRYIKANPHLKAEFSAWQEAFVSEPVPATVKVRNKLIRKEFNYRKPIVYFVAGFMAATWLFIKFWKPTHESSGLPAEQKTTINRTDSPSIRIEKNASEPDKTEAITFISSVVKNSGKPEILGKIPDVEDKLNLLHKHDSIADEPEVNVKSHETFDSEEEVNLSGQDEQHVEYIDTTGQINVISISDKSDNEKVAQKPKRKLTRGEKQQLRRIARAKRKMEQKKEAQQFINGDKPYVVPLNPNNF